MKNKKTISLKRNAEHFPAFKKKKKKKENKEIQKITFPVVFLECCGWEMANSLHLRNEVHRKLSSDVPEAVRPQHEK